MVAAVIVPIAAVFRGRPVEVPVRRPAPGRAPLPPTRLFVVGVLVEAVLIGAVVALVFSTGRADVMMPAIAIAVGAHLIVFYLLHGDRLHLWTTLAGVASGAVPLALRLSGLTNGVDTNALTGLGMGAVTLVYAWVFARTVRRRPHRPNASARSSAGRAR